MTAGSGSGRDAATSAGAFAWAGGRAAVGLALWHAVAANSDRASPAARTWVVTFIFLCSLLWSRFGLSRSGDAKCYYPLICPVNRRYGSWPLPSAQGRNDTPGAFPAASSLAATAATGLPWTARAPTAIVPAAAGIGCSWTTRSALGLVPGEGDRGDRASGRSPGRAGQKTKTGRQDKLAAGETAR